VGEHGSAIPVEISELAEYLDLLGDLVDALKRLPRNLEIQPVVSIGSPMVRRDPLVSTRML
jgi:hypothetical protein